MRSIISVSNFKLKHPFNKYDYPLGYSKSNLSFFAMPTKRFEPPNSWSFISLYSWPNLLPTSGQNHINFPQVFVVQFSRTQSICVVNLFGIITHYIKFENIDQCREDYLPNLGKKKLVDPLLFCYNLMMWLWKRFPTADWESTFPGRYKMGGKAGKICIIYSE